MSDARHMFGAGDHGRSIQVGLVLALIVWCALLFLFGLAARHLGGGANSSASLVVQSSPMFSIELAPDTPPIEEQIKDDDLKKLARPQPEEEKRLVPINPDAPDNVPDTTRNLGSRNQQAAQETPNFGKDNDIPSTIDGDPEFGTVIKEGRIESSQAVSAIIPDAAEGPVYVAQQVQGNAVQDVEGLKQSESARDILSGTEDLIGQDEHGVGSNIVKLPPKAPLAETKIDGYPLNSPIEAEARSKGAERVIDPKQPRPRPRLDAGQIGTLIHNPHGTRNSGIIASDARWSRFGEYDQKMYETIAMQWHAMLGLQKVYPIDGSYVIVAFRLNHKGEVAELIGTESTAGLLMERLCVSAITSRAPFGPWPDDMRAVLGEDVVLKIKFSF
jgi:hypothetical protein